MSDIPFDSTGEPSSSNINFDNVSVKQPLPIAPQNFPEITSVTGFVVSGSSVTFPISASLGGTGIGSYVVGDMLYADTVSSLAKLAIGAETFVLTVSGGLPVWAAPTGMGFIGGSGTANKIPKFATGSTLTDSLISELSGIITIAGNLHVTSSGNPAIELRSSDANGLSYIDFVKNASSSTVPDYGGRIIYNVPSTPDGFQFYTAGTATAKVVIDTNGNLGVATLAPTEKIHVVNGNIKIGSGFGLVLGDASPAAIAIGHSILSTNPFYLAVRNLADTADIPVIEVDASGTIFFGAQVNDDRVVLQSAVALDFTIANVRKMYLDNVGLGIGMLPENRLSIKGDTILSGTTIGVVRIDSAYASATSIQSLDFSINANDNLSARIANPTDATGAFGELSFYTTLSHSTTPPTEKVRISGNGYVGIGTSIPARSLHIHEPAFFLFTNAATGATANDGFQIFLAGTDVYLEQQESAAMIFRTSATNRLTISAAGDFGINGSDFQDGVKVMFIANSTTAPTTNPTGGVLFYIDAGTPKFRTPAGNVFSLSKSSPYTPTNVTTDRSYDANATTLDEVADVLGTLISDLQTNGWIG